MLFVLLILVSLLANYLAVQLPPTMINLESQHILQVENQLGQLEEAILLQSQRMGVPMSITSPLSLGSPGAPPFGQGSAGTLTTHSTAVGSAAMIRATSSAPLNISWTSPGSCPNNCMAHFLNWTRNNTNGGSISARGTAGNEVFLNMLGQNNSNFNVDLRGIADTAFVVIGGSNNSLTFTNSGKAGSVNATFILYGQFDTLDLSSLTKLGLVNVIYIGYRGNTCPYQNYSSTDQLFLPASSVLGLNVTVTWWNAVGYSAPLHQVTDPNTGFVYWNQSITGAVGCAFTVSSTSSYSTGGDDSLIVHLDNHYLPGTDVVSEEGALIQSTPGQSAVLVAPPFLSLVPSQSTLGGAFTFFNFLGNPVTASGYSVAGVTTRIVSVNQLTLASVPGVQYNQGFRIAVTTAYPAAWASFFSTHANMFPSGASCVSVGPSPGPVSCLAVPATGHLVTISAIMSVPTLLVTIINVALSVR